MEKGANSLLFRFQRDLTLENPFRISHSLLANHSGLGEVTEWLNVPVLKTGVRASVPWVRIPPSPPYSQK